MLNSLMDITAAGGALGIPGLYVTGDPGGVDEAAKNGSLSPEPRHGLGEVAVLHHRPVPGDEVQPPADDGDPARQGADREGRQREGDHAWRTRREGYAEFDAGAATKYVLNPNGYLS